jgi:hypothetical protein
MLAMLGFVVAWGAAIAGYAKARSFVRDRLRYVEGVHRSFVPLKVGLLVGLATAPVAWLLPIVTTGTAILLGTAVGLGVSAGRKDIRERRYLRAG